MTEQNFNTLRRIVKSYSDQRDKVHEKVAQIRQDVKDRRINARAADVRILQLYTDRANCPERQHFIREEKKIHNDPKFEKYFKLAVMEYFFRNKVRPEDFSDLTQYQ